VPAACASQGQPSAATAGFSRVRISKLEQLCFGPRQPQAFNSSRLKKMAANGEACIICLDTSPPPIQSGCACRGDSGLAHIACLARAAVSQQAHRGSEAWRECQTCKQHYTGAMQRGLAEAWRSRVAGQAAESAERIAAENYLAMSLLHQGMPWRRSRCFEDCMR
jgi:hypothetical protein